MLNKIKTTIKSLNIISAQLGVLSNGTDPSVAAIIRDLTNELNKNIVELNTIVKDIHNDQTNVVSQS